MTVNKQEMSTRAYVGAFNFKGQDQQKNVGKLSGGERNRVHMAKMLKTGGNVLLLDEPTNDLDVETLAALEDAIENFAGCAVVISHDRFFLDRLATHILAFEGNSHVEWFEGNFEAYEEDKRRRLGDAADRPTRLAYKKQEADAKFPLTQPGLGDFKGGLHPHQRICRNPERFLKPQRHQRGQAGMAVEEQAHVLAADIQHFGHLCHSHLVRFHDLFFQPRAWMNQDRRVQRNCHQW
jgi:ABC-type multidrug transport system ATPase subunit